jgi:hypothetical protein
MCELNIVQEFGIIYWFLFDEYRYESYMYWLEVGLKPKYAYEKAKNKK